MASGESADEDTCSCCGGVYCACFEAGIEGFRIWCAFCDHLTECYPDLNLAQREWRGSREASNDEAGRG